MATRKIELLSPAGSFESIRAAINAGADSVYFGVEQLNMRTRSSGGFSINDIHEVARLCHGEGLRVYITLNTVMYDHDLYLLRMILQEAKRCHVDAVIASDFSVIGACRDLHIPVHISTQANVSNIEAVRFFSPMSDRVVLARELTLQQVAEIRKEIDRKGITGVSGQPMQIEIFAHGALCMAISGKCYMSLHTQNASANRGACLQNCRRPYIVSDAETGEELMIDNEYIMSPKDLCTIGMLKQLIVAGANAIKIEGRSKGPDYVYTVTKCYRQALDAIRNGTYTEDRIRQWEDTLSSVYNRGFWEGYYLGRKLGEWSRSPGSTATEKKVYVGKGCKYYTKIGVGEFHIEAGTLKKGDTVLLIGNNHGMIKERMDPLFVNGTEAEEARKGDRITFAVRTKVVPGDRLYKLIPNRDVKDHSLQG